MYKFIFQSIFHETLLNFSTTFHKILLNVSTMYFFYQFLIYSLFQNVVTVLANALVFSYFSV